MFRILGNYPICFVCPHGINLDYQETNGKKFEIKRFSDSFFEDTASYSRLLLSEFFYREFIEFDYILIYQLDAFVFEDELATFCDANIDYVGTPIFLDSGFWSKYHIGNGGLSLRNVKKSLELVGRKEEILEAHPYRNLAERAEDVFFSYCAGEDAYDYKGASYEQAKRFALLINNLDLEEDVYKNGLPFGIHYFSKENMRFWGKFIRAYGYHLSSQSREQNMSDYLDMMNQWLILKQEGKSVENYLCRHGVRTIAVYGVGIYGRHLIRDLSKSNVKVSYAIDRKPQKPYQDVPVITPDKPIIGVDLIVNSVLSDREGIDKNLRSLTDIPVVAIDDLIFESYFTDDAKAPWRNVSIGKK